MGGKYMSSSFISERSAEYILVPQFCELLNLTYKKVTPIYFWSTREGASHSKASFKNNKVLIVALYARRPKVPNINSEYIELKFNEELFSRSTYLNDNGIPVFGGAPLVTILDDFYIGAPCKWFNIMPAKLYGDEYIYIRKTGEVEKSVKNVNVVSTSGIIEIIQNSAKEHTWETAINIIRNNKDNNRISRWFISGGYKPVYFILDIS
jgi:hypothetical protein